MTLTCMGSSLYIFYIFYLEHLGCTKDIQNFKKYNLTENQLSTVTCIIIKQWLLPRGTSSLNVSRARTMSSSVSNGMSPQIKSYSRMPRDHIVAGMPWYCCREIHSGGLYTRVPDH